MKLKKILHYLLCDTTLVIQLEGRHQFLECPCCRYRTPGWEW